MSSEIAFEQMKLAMEETKPGTMGYFMTREKVLKEWVSWLKDYSSTLCTSYNFGCELCGSKDHINYQCKNIDDTILAYYNGAGKCFAHGDIHERVLYTGCFELLSRISKLNIEDEVLDKINGMTYIYCTIIVVITLVMMH